MALTIIKGGVERVDWKDFSGGVVLDDGLDLAENQFPAGLNLTNEFDGLGLGARFGSVVLDNTMPDDGTGAIAKLLAVDWTQAVMLVAKGTKLYIYNIAGGTWATVPGVFTAAATPCAVAFRSEFVYSNTIDGVYTIDYGAVGATLRAAVTGSCMAVWQTKVYVGGCPAAAGGNIRVNWCNSLNSHVWTVGTDFIDVVEGYGGMIALCVVDGMDVQGRAGFLIVKNEGLFRMNSPSTGAYTTLSISVGCASPSGVCSLEGKAYILQTMDGLRGVWVTDGVNQPVRISRNIDPLLQRKPGAFAANAPGNTDDWICARGKRVFCALSQLAAGGAGDHTQYVAEYDPAGQAWFLHKFGAKLHTPMVPSEVGPGSTVVDGVIFARADANSNRTFVALDPTGGSFSDGRDVDGAGGPQIIFTSLHTGWRWPQPGRRVLPQRIFFRGRTGGGNITVGVRSDYKTAVASGFTIQSGSPTVVMLPVTSRGPAGAVSIDVSWNSVVGLQTALVDEIPGSGVAQTKFAINSVGLEYAKLGL